MFRCVSQNQMTIVFSCQKETARFSVSPAPEADEYRPIEDTVSFNDKNFYSLSKNVGYFMDIVF